MIRWIVLLIYSTAFCATQDDIDPNGYVMFCPCMGRFGNQAEQLLGVLTFTQVLNRTLVLPHWVEYPPRSLTSSQIPFDRYFQVEPLRSYLKVILMKDFVDRLAEKVWPKGKRNVFCYAAQKNEKSDKESCHAKDGNPFGPFWTHFDIDFDGDIFFEPLFFYIDTPEGWDERYPPAEYPVLAFNGPPGLFPGKSEERDIPLAKYLVYSDYIRKKAESFLKQHQISPESLLALHIRNGVDFERACTHVRARSNFFASAQCLGHNLESDILLTQDICYPSEENIVKQTEKEIKRVKPTVLFVAADGDDMTDKFQRRFAKKYHLRVVKYERPDSQTEGEAAHMDLFMLSIAENAIVNCPSSFSAFAKRQRDNRGKSTDFWGVESGNRAHLPNTDL